MDRTDFFFALCGLIVGALVATAGSPAVFDKMFVAGAVVLGVVGFVSISFVLRRLSTDHRDIYNEIGATHEDLSWGMGDAFGRFRTFLHGSRHRELDDGLLSIAVIAGRASWRSSFVLAGIALFFAFRSLTG